MATKHVVDPTYFYDAIAEFAFDYHIYHVSKGPNIDEYGKQRYSYEESIINCSLQSQGHKRLQKAAGNVDTWQYKFYCKSIYRIYRDDIIKYQNKYLLVTEVNDYDEWGVREGTCELINIAAYRDFREWLKYKEGKIIA